MHKATFGKNLTQKKTPHINCQAQWWRDDDLQAKKTQKK